MKVQNPVWDEDEGERKRFFAPAIAAFSLKEVRYFHAKRVKISPL